SSPGSAPGAALPPSVRVGPALRPRDREGVGSPMARTPRNVTTDALVMALACGATVEHAARKAGLSERSVYRRLARPAFRAQVNQARLELIQRTAGMLAGAGLGSVKTLVDLQQDSLVAAAVRRGAARDVLTLSLRFLEASQLEPRLAALEARGAQSPAPDAAPPAGAQPPAESPSQPVPDPGETPLEPGGLGGAAEALGSRV